MILVGDRVLVKNDPTKTIWTVQDIKGEYAICLTMNYDDMRNGTFKLDNLEPVD